MHVSAVVCLITVYNLIKFDFKNAYKMGCEYALNVSIIQWSKLKAKFLYLEIVILFVFNWLFLFLKDDNKKSIAGVT